MLKYKRIVTCRDCGKSREVRKDSSPLRCKSCVAKIKGAKGLVTIRKNTKTTPCLKCDKPIATRLNYTYCSVECRKVDKRTLRTCKKCNSEFSIVKSVLKTNASGNF